jgi:putative membrane protein
MYHDGSFYFGMHAIWWLVWIVVIAAFVMLLVRALGRREDDAKTTANAPRETPLAILRRRYAAGEISTSDYEERKAVLERDALPANRGGGA